MDFGEVLATWRGVFQQCGDQTTSQQAQQWIRENIGVLGPVQQLQLFLTLSDSAESVGVRIMAAIAIQNVLKYRTKSKLDEIKAGWMPEKEIRARMKALCYSNILAEDGTLRRQWALIFSLVYGIEATEWPEALTGILEHLRIGIGQGELVKVACLLEVFGEILGLPNAADLARSTEQGMQLFVQIVMEALNVVGIDNLQVKSAALSCIRDSVEKMGDLIIPSTPETACEAIIHILVQTESGLQCGDVPTFTACQRIYYNLIEKFYHISQGFVGKIFEYTMGVLSSENPEVAPFKCKALYMWKAVADYEKNHRESKHHCLTAIPSLFDGCIRRELINVNPADTDVEDPAMIDETLLAYITQMLMSFCECEPEAMLQGITPIFDGFSTAPDWVSQHAALLLGQSFCGDRIIEDQRNRPAPPIIDFLMNKVFRYAIEIAKTTVVPRLKETSLYIIALILEALACEFGKMRKPDAVGMITEIVRSFDDKIGNPIIMTRYCGIIYQLCKLWKDNRDFSAIEEFFDQFGQMLSVIMEMPITSDYEKERFTQASEAMNRLVMYAPQSKVPQLSGLYMGTLGNIHTMMQSTESDAVKFVKIAGMCSNLTSLVMRFGKDVPEDAFRQTLTMLFTILSRQEVSIYEEGVMTLTSMVMQQPQLITPDDCRAMCGIIHGALESGAPGVINAAAVLIGDLFRHKTQDVIELFPDMFNKLFGLLANSEEMRDVHPFIVKAIAEMVEGSAASMRDPSLPENDAGDEARRTLAPFEEQYIIMMKNMRAMVINVDDRKSVEYANYLYEFLSKAYRVYGLVYAIDIGKKTRAELSPEQQQRERGMLLELDAFARMVYRLGNKASDYLLLEFSKMLKIFASKCSRRNNVILNRVSVHNVLKVGANDRARPQKVQKELKATIGLLKST